uniref:UPAR/Ly6 domain-containing protein n=1 Tax=Myripristis murdjan TaxID=586833 RepID=A0A667X9X4_9TELE
ETCLCVSCLYVCFCSISSVRRFVTSLLLKRCHFNKVTSFNVSGLLSLQTRGCLDTTSCNKTQTGTLLTAGYTVTKTCCSTDRCNGATSIQLPLTAAVGAALLAMWSTWAY